MPQISPLSWLLIPFFFLVFLFFVMVGVWWLFLGEYSFEWRSGKSLDSFSLGSSVFFWKW